MAYPTKYTRQFDFNSYQNANPTRPLPGGKVNVDLDSVKLSVTEIIDFLKGFVRSDGKLANGSVGVDQLNPNLNLGFSLPTMWEPATDYTADSTVLYANKFWKAKHVHTSTDGFDEEQWSLIVDFGAQATAAAASAEAAAASEGAAADSAASAASQVADAIAGLGDLAHKDKATVSDLEVSGVPNGTKFLRDDGSWVTPAGGGDMVKVNNLSDVSDPNASLNNLGSTPSFNTVALAGAYSPKTAPGHIDARSFDSSISAGSNVDYVLNDVVDTGSPGQLMITANGVNYFYTRSNKVLRPQAYGCRTGGNPAANRAALQKMLADADWYGGREIDMGSANDLYEIDAGFTYVCNSKPTMRGTGATIKLSSSGANSQSFGFRLVTQNLGFDLEGFGVDANRKATNPLCVTNPSTVYDPSTVFEGRGVGLFGLNGYRRVITDYSGRGVWVSGYFTYVRLEDIVVKNMAIAAGASDLTTGGVIGIYAGRDGSVSDDAPMHVDIINPYIDRVYSEDPAYTHDQDAISLLMPIPTNNANKPPHSVSIRGGKIVDGCGRGVKAQVCNIDVSGTMFVSKTNQSTEGMMVDFQFGTGIARGIRGYAYNGRGWKYGVVGTARTYCNGTMLVDNMAVSGAGTPMGMTAMLFRASEAGHPAGSVTLSNSASEAQIILDKAIHYTDLTNAGLATCIGNTFRNITTSGALLEGSGSNIINCIFKNNAALGSVVPRTTNSNCSPNVIGGSLDNLGFS